MMSFKKNSCAVCNTNPTVLIISSCFTSVKVPRIPALCVTLTLLFSLFPVALLVLKFLEFLCCV